MTDNTLLRNTEIAHGLRRRQFYDRHFQVSTLQSDLINREMNINFVWNPYSIVNQDDSHDAFHDTISSILSNAMLNYPVTVDGCKSFILDEIRKNLDEFFILPIETKPKRRDSRV